MKKLFLINYLFIAFTIAAVTIANQDCRNIIILLDQEGDMENIGRTNRWFLTTKLQSALNEEAAPILINASLWNNFVERRLSIQQMSQMPDSPEHNALETYNKIGERLTYWMEHYKNNDPMQVKQLALERVNNEFYLNEMDFHKAVSNELGMALISYLTHFDKNNWEIYSNEKSFYLLVPKKYLQELQKKELEAITSKNLSEKELMLGLKVDHLTVITDIIDDPIRGYLNGINLEKHISYFLDDFFVTKQELEQQEMPYQWNIIFSGHGGYRYREITTDKVTLCVEAILADLPPREFQSVLEFCEHSISTNCFYYTCCYGAGNHIKIIYDDNNNPLYSYTIICGCISDGQATCLWHFLPFPSANRNTLKLSDIICDYDGKWHIKVDHEYEWKKFFNSLEQNSFKNDLSWFIEILPSVNFHALCDNPIIRLPNSNSFVPVLSNGLFTINNNLIALKQVEKSESITIADATTILVEAPIIPLPIIIQNTAPITSIAPGNAQHYFEKIEFKQNNNFLDTFISIEGDWFDTHFVIQELIIKNDKDSLIGKKLGIENEKIIAKNVLVHIQQDWLVRIFAEINENYYMFTSNLIKIDYKQAKSELKGISKMSPKVSEIYLEKYHQLKDKIIKG